MANTGILLRKDNKQTFVGDFLPQEGEMVFAQDTFEIGMMLDGEVYWQPWVSTANSANYLLYGDDEPTNDLGDNSDKYIQKKELNGFIELVEFKKEDGEWRQIHKGVTQDWLTTNLEVHIHDETYPYLGKYNYKMQEGYSPLVDLDVATKDYLDNVPGVAGKVTLDGTSPMDVGYVPTQDGDLVTANFMSSGDAEITIPTQMYDIPGSLWNDDGELKFSSEYMTNFSIHYSPNKVANAYFSREIATTDKYVISSFTNSGGTRTIGKFDFDMNFIDGISDFSDFGIATSSSAYFGAAKHDTIIVEVNGRVRLVNVETWEVGIEFSFPVIPNRSPTTYPGGVAIGDTRAVITDWGVNRLDNADTNNDFGIAYIYDLQGNFINHIESIQNDADFAESFGEYPQIHNDHVFIGELYYGIPGVEYAGAVHMFSPEGVHMNTFRGSQYFYVGSAYDVDMERNLLVYPSAGGDRVYLANLDRVGGYWFTYLSDPLDPGDFDDWGNSAYFTDRKLLITQWGDGPNNSGSIYVYNIDTFEYERRILAPSASYTFGTELAWNGRIVYVGDPRYSDDGLSREGAVYRYE